MTEPSQAETCSSLPTWIRMAEGATPEDVPMVAVWSGEGSPPTVGETVTAAINGLGRATVVGYRVVDGFLGIVVDLEAAPAWHVRQNGGDPRGLLFGREIAAAA